MSKKYFMDSISDERLAKMIDKTLNHEKTTKNRSIKTNLLKMIPAAAAVVLVIGAINILPFLNIIGVNEHENAASHGIDVSAADNDGLIINSEEETEPEQTQEEEYNAHALIGGGVLAKAGVLAIGYNNADGETVIRMSNDGGMTWHKSDDVNYIPDPDLSGIEWLTYDECRTWLDNKKSELSDEDIAWYESALENMKDGEGEAGKVNINNEEIMFIFSDLGSYGESDYTYSEDKNLELYKYVMSSGGVSGGLTKVTVDGAEWYIKTSYGKEIVNDDGSVSYEAEVYLYRYESDDGEDIIAFGATTFEELRKIVSEHFDERIQAGKMTQEEADDILAELTKDSIRKTITVDSEGNIIK